MNSAQKWGLGSGLIIFVVLLLLPPPAGMALLAWRAAALVILMAMLWMTEALPLTVTALLPFVAFPFMGILSADKVAAAYYSPILFLVLGGAFIALAIERTGLHRRFALTILARGGRSAGSLLLAFMIATACISMIVSNTATALIMMPIAVAVLRANRTEAGDTEGLAGALPMGIAFAASIGGLGTLVGSPTNAIAAGLIETSVGYRIDFLTWSLYGLPIVALAIPVCWFILMRIQNVAVGWVLLPLMSAGLPKGMVEDGTIAILIALLLFVVPDGTGRPILVWKEADRAPWGVIMMFGGGLALAAGISASGLAGWLGEALEPLSAVHPVIVALSLVALVILVTEFASNVATASGIMPVVGGLIVATGADPALLAVSAAMAASWGFMLPSGTGPNAIAWATDHIALPRMLKAGLTLDLVGIPLIVGVVWMMGQVIG